jgi:hypothetical protein
MQVQRGRDELIAPKSASAEKLIFEFDIEADITGDKPNFLGKFAQGPKHERFVYVNSGSYAGQSETIWSRRAKLSLMSVTRKDIERILESGKRLETTINGIGRDGGPVCASVKDIKWTAG